MLADLGIGQDPVFGEVGGRRYSLCEDVWSLVSDAGLEGGGSELEIDSPRVIENKTVCRGAAVLVLYGTPAYLASVAAGGGVCSGFMVHWYQMDEWDKMDRSWSHLGHGHSSLSHTAQSTMTPNLPVCPSCGKSSSACCELERT
jgi:hypothetical protein